MNNDFGAGIPGKDPLRLAMENVSAAEANSPPDPSIMSRALAEEDALSEDLRLRDRIERERQLAIHMVGEKAVELRKAYERLQAEIVAEKNAITQEFDKRLRVANRAIEAREAAIEVLKRGSDTPPVQLSAH
jgi:hypothetical protein